MPSLPPAVAEIRLAVRTALADLPDGSTVVVALSGGADSLALAAATAFEARARRITVHSATVDHGLQKESSAVTVRAVEQATALGIIAGQASGHITGEGGPEAAARRFRYRAIGDLARFHDADAVLLGHTLDDRSGPDARPSRTRGR